MGISILMEKMFILKKPYRISKMFLEKISVYFSSITVQGQTYSAYLPSPIPITYKYNYNNLPIPFHHPFNAHA